MSARSAVSDRYHDLLPRERICPICAWDIGDSRVSRASEQANTLVGLSWVSLMLSTERCAAVPVHNRHGGDALHNTVELFFST